VDREVRGLLDGLALVRVLQQVLRLRAQRETQ
jgi:hypothetical protein